jgi:hypothetical protein
MLSMANRLREELQELDSDVAVDSLANVLIRARISPQEAYTMDKTLTINYPALATIAMALDPIARTMGLSENDAKLMQIGSMLSAHALTEAAERQLFEHFVIRPPEEGRA